MENEHLVRPFVPWSKGVSIDPKASLKLKEIRAIRIHLQMAKDIRQLALFNLAIDSKLRGCDLVNLRIQDVARGRTVGPRAMIVQRLTIAPFVSKLPLKQGRNGKTEFAELF